MNIAEWSLNKSVITWVMTILMLVVGISSFGKLSRLEDPEFTIKEAVVFTPYPGASAAEVEEEVSNVIEKAAQELGQLDYVESRSSRGLSIVKTYIKKKYDKDSLPQVWDELRRKVNDAQSKLPPGAGPSLVNDDFGDVYGIYLALTGDGYNQKEMHEFAKFLQRELLTVKDVKRIILHGVQKEAVYVEMSRDKMAEFGISPEDIFRALSSKNLPVTSGNITIGSEYITVSPTGEFKSEKEFGDLLISSRGPGKRLVYLKDVAEIKRDYQQPAKNLLRYDGDPAIGLGISTVFGGNVVTMGEKLKERLQSLTPVMPLGVEFHVIALQSDAVTVAIKGFLVSLIEAVVIVVVVLLFFMGLRSGLIIGSILFITISGTFIFMDMLDITLERISLGALVIALGMLVDNAIVVTDGIRVRMQQGMDAFTASSKVVGQTGIPLLGATVVAVTAFASIGTSPDSTGEYTRALFTVILISLMLSWLTAVTSTPLFCKHFLMGKKASAGGSQDPYAGKFYVLYRQILGRSIRNRWATLVVVIVIFATALFGFGYVKQSFFPDSTRPQFYVDYWFPEGTHIDETTLRMKEAEEHLQSKEGVTGVATEIGGSNPRMLLTYSGEYPYHSFARTLVSVENYSIISDMTEGLQTELEQRFPDVNVSVRMFVNGPSTGGKIQLRIYGPDAEEIRKFGTIAEQVMLDEPNAKAVRNEWRTQVKVVRPQMSEAQARQVGIDRPQLAHALEAAVEGTAAGVYRERDELLPIIARSPEHERVDLDNLGGIQVWSPAAQTMIPADQVVTGFVTEFENPHIWRRNRAKMLKIHADPRTGLPSELMKTLKPRVEQALNVDLEAVLGRQPEQHTHTTLTVTEDNKWPIKGKPGYYMAWGGELEDSAKANASLGEQIPIFFGLMVIIVLWLFNSIKKTLIIWLTVPLSLIGVTAGLLLLNQPFGFMSVLGLMSLSGMLIKNAIVLIDEIDTQLASGKEAFHAIVDSGVSRLIPVVMAAATTILGLIPLLKDAFFVSMAVTLMFGLGFATVLTLIVVPVLYATFYKVPNA